MKIKKIAFVGIVALFLTSIFLFTPSANAYVSVDGYYRKDGTYVSPYVRSEPNGLKYDNYSYTPSQGLYNDTYGTRGDDWDTPTYITDPDYYTGKYLYDLNNGDSYSSPNYNYSVSTPSCPSNSYYDSINDSCKCNFGYVVSGNSCVYGNTFCSNDYGYGAEYNSLNNSCECRYGYRWNGSMTSCISNNDYCEVTYGYHSSASYSGKCECDHGYYFDGYSCIEENEENDSGYAPPVTTVHCPINSIAIGDSCYCQVGYEVNSDKTGCEKKINTNTIDTIPSSDISTKTKETKQSTPKPEVNCNSGFAPSLDNSHCIKIPAHAHAVDSKIDVWLCDSGYEEVGNFCVEETNSISNDVSIKGVLRIPGTLRDCPSTECKIIRYYAETAAVLLVGVDESNSWYKVEANDDYGKKLSGWMHHGLFAIDNREKFFKKNNDEISDINITNDSTSSQTRQTNDLSWFKRILRFIFGD